MLGMMVKTSTAAQSCDAASIYESIRNNLEYESYSFPLKLYTMLEDAETKGFAHVVSWQPGSQSFRVLDPAKFSSEIMRIYFNQTKYKSFQRQLNIYEFARIHSGPNKGGYFHQYFLRGSRELCTLILRRSSNQGSKAIQNAFKEYTSQEEKIQPLSLSPRNTFESFQLDECDLDLLCTLNSWGGGYDNNCHETGKLGCDDNFDDSSFSGKDDDTMDLTLSKSTSPLPDTNTGELLDNLTNTLNEGVSMEERNRDNSARANYSHFPWKLHLMLEEAERDKFTDIVSWVHTGLAFKVHKPEHFVSKVMPRYFDQTKYESFRRQLNLYGFCRVTCGLDRGVYSHPSFRRSDRGMCQNIVRPRSKIHPKGKR